ncbi:hypothetical protein CVT26_010248 [Gymnopilus dilepis]|uniref:DUF1996 domain-containing protein n=1 Tax=Gymnopilus dilepis TaxID=231916 RepID=A0A409Y0Z5_9AGAR|nr:hypothetical protein CVT26_010248 [Gymnopilus dilepis]
MPASSRLILCPAASMPSYRLPTIALIAAALSCQPANAWFRVACTTPLVQERLDPIISPGVSPSNHVHTIHGGNMFASNSTYDTLRTSTCTNCLVSQLLPYEDQCWCSLRNLLSGFPKLYFQDPRNKSFTPVPDGGLLVYYENRGGNDTSNGGTGLKAFPPGFKMISGSPTRRSRKFTPGEGSQGELAERAIEWECLRYTNSSTPGYNSDQTVGGFPTTDCEAGLNSRIHFPSCWDGVNVDSPDHTSHTAFLSDLDNGNCPSTHPVGLMTILYEVTWNVHAFAESWNSSSDPWPFVWGLIHPRDLIVLVTDGLASDPTGYSWHGDFQNGWDTQVLQNAIDKCNNPNDQTAQGVTEACSFLTVTNATTAGECKIAPTVSETIDGLLDKLPGCNPIQAGPQDATLHSDANCQLGVASPTPTPGKSAAMGNFVSVKDQQVLILSLGAVLASMLFGL